MYLGGEFWGLLTVLIAMTAMLFGLQSVIIRIGELFPSVECLGIAIDAVLGFILIAPLFLGSSLTEHEGNGNMFVASLAIMGIYVSVVWYFNWFCFIACIVILWFNLRWLEKLGGDVLWIYCGACFYILYCIGAYFALLINNFAPAADIYGIAVLSAAAIVGWMYPVFA